MRHSYKTSKAAKMERIKVVDLFGVDIKRDVSVRLTAAFDL